MERSTGLLVPVPVVGVVRPPSPASTQFLKEARSFVLISRMGSWSCRSGWVAGGVTNSRLGVGAGVVLGLALGVATGSSWDPVGWKSARNSFKVFSIFRP